MKIEDWQASAGTFKETFKLKGEPISVTYTDRKYSTDDENPYTVCKALLLVRNGKTIYLTKKNCLCPGGAHYLGFAGTSARGIEGFLSRGEKLYSSIVTARIMLNRTEQLAPPPAGLMKSVILTPLSKVEKAPDLIVILGTPWQAGRISTLVGYDKGTLAPFVSEGSLCWSAIIYPLMTNNFNVSIGDITARKKNNYDDNELLISIPKSLVSGVLSNIKYCTAGTAKAGRI